MTILDKVAGFFLFGPSRARDRPFGQEGLNARLVQGPSYKMGQVTPNSNIDIAISSNISMFAYR